MKKNSLSIFAASLFCFFLSACITTQKEVSEKEIRYAEAVVGAFLHHGLVIIDDLSEGNKIIAAQQMFKTEDGGICRIDHDHSSHIEKGHPFTLVVQATPEENGEFSQKTIGLGEKKFFYKILYAATIEEKHITITKSIATEGSPSRSNESTERELLEDIAKNLNGKIQGDRITLQ